MNADNLVEVLARAVCKSQRWEGPPSIAHMHDVRAMITALEAAGYRVLPYICTDRMRCEGKIALREDYESGGITKIWWAMLNEYADECKDPAAPKVDSPAAEGGLRDG